MKLIYASSPSHDILKEHFFLGTLCEPWELVEIRFDLAGDGSYNTPSWNRIVTERMTYLLNIIRDNESDVVVFADVDIQWFRPCQAAILSALEDRDIVFQREFVGRNLVNCGFFAVRCNARSVALFEQIVAATKEGWNEQAFMNHLVSQGKMPCHYGHLPRTFLNDNLDGPHAPPDNELLLYHSVNTPSAYGKHSLQVKLERHLAMRARVLGSRAVLRTMGQPLPMLDRRPTMARTSADILGLASGPRRFLIQFHSVLPPAPFQNVILHPDGALFGGVNRMACRQWRLADGQLQFLDQRGQVRLVFDPIQDGTWTRCQPRHPMPKQKSPAEVPATKCRLVPERPFAHGKSQFEIVVAKFKEDVRWTEAYAGNVTIYSKDAADAGLYPVLPNIGREGGTYLFHIVENYERLADRTLFLQGNPFPHPLLPLANYALDARMFTAAPFRESKMTWKPTWAQPAQLIDEATMRAFLELLECNPSIDCFEWVQGAQFAVAREQIRKRPRAFYERLFDLTQQNWSMIADRRFDNHHIAWLFELFWPLVFTA